LFLAEGILARPGQDMLTQPQLWWQVPLVAGLMAVVLDLFIDPVEGAVVLGHWSGLTGDIDSGVTDENGSVSLKSNKVRNTGGTFTFTVDDLTKDGWTYDPAANDETTDSIV